MTANTLTTSNESNKTTESFNFTPEKKDLLKRAICKNSTDDELDLFIHACQRTGLDPFMKQIYAIKRGNLMTIQTGIDGYRLIAERTGKYMPGKEPTFVFDEKKNLVSATSYVKKMDTSGVWHEIAATAYLPEYDAGSQIWKKMPCAMLAKCSESLVLRKAFPADLSGIYTKEEMDQASAEEIVASAERVTSIGEVVKNVQPASDSIPEEKVEYIHPQEAYYIDIDIQTKIHPIDSNFKKNVLDYLSKKASRKITNFEQITPAMAEWVQKQIDKKLTNLVGKELSIPPDLVMA